MGPLFSLFMFTVGCGGSPAPDPVPTETVSLQQPTTLTVYSGRGESLVGELFENIPADAPFRVEVQYGKTAEMVTRLITEGEQSPADVIFAQDSGHLGALAQRDALAPLPDSILSQIDPQFRDHDGRWVGTSGRLRVLVYDSKTLGPDDLPKTLEDLALSLIHI